MDEECKHFSELFLVWAPRREREREREDRLTTSRLILVTLVGEKRMQTFLPNEGKGRWECS